MARPLAARKITAGARAAGRVDRRPEAGENHSSWGFENFSWLFYKIREVTFG
jgi:hypothetical protein